MTNYEKIQNMSPEEMARFLCRYIDGVPCLYCTAHNTQYCKEYIKRRKDWLNEESEE